jgi:hypothetical protein
MSIFEVNNVKRILHFLTVYCSDARNSVSLTVRPHVGTLVTEIKQCVQR